VREVVATLLVCFFLGWGEFVECFSWGFLLNLLSFGAKFKSLSWFQGFKRGKKPIKIEFCWRYMYLPT
jgi:hypothetical protein